LNWNPAILATLTSPEFLDGGDLLPGFLLPLASLFGQAEKNG
jgi:hypothetical protein